MAAEKETLQRVQGGLFHLQKGLTPFVEGRMKTVHGATWLHHASRAAGSSPNAALDAYGLVKTMLDRWREVFDDAFGRSDKHKARNFTSMALEARNANSHLSIGLQDDEALRYLDAMHQLLKLVKAPAVETAELKKLYDAQRQSGLARAPAPEPPKLDLAIGDARRRARFQDHGHTPGFIAVPPPEERSVEISDQPRPAPAGGVPLLTVQITSVRHGRPNSSTLRRIVTKAPWRASLISSVGVFLRRPRKRSMP